MADVPFRFTVDTLITRSQIEHFAAALYLEEFLTEQPEALVTRIAWADLPRKIRIKYRKRALQLLQEPIE